MFNFNGPIGRLTYFKERLKNLGRYCVAGAAFLVGLNAASVAGVGLIGLASVVALFSLVKSLEITNRRLLDVAPGADAILTWGVTILAAILTCGVSSLALFFLPSNLIKKKQLANG